MSEWRRWVGRKLMNIVPDVEPHERLPLMRVSAWLLPRSPGADERIAELRAVIRSVASEKFVEAFERRFDEATVLPTVDDLEVAARVLRRIGHSFEARLSMIGRALEHVNRSIDDARHAERQVEEVLERGE